jgi:hypothetical protein
MVHRASESRPLPDEDPENSAFCALCQESPGRCVITCYIDRLTQESIKHQNPHHRSG